MYRNILIAFDGSDSSYNALEQATKFAREGHCNVSAISVLSSHYKDSDELGDLGAFGADEVTEFFVGSGESILPNLQTTVEQCTKIQAVEVDGNIYKAIVEAAQSRGYDLIVMGRKGRSGLNRAFMGSVTARVIGYSPVDVLVMPSDTVLSWHKILLATDGSEYSKRASDKAVELARDYGAELEIISVVDIPYEAYGDAPDMYEKLEKQALNIVEDIRSKAEEFNIKAGTMVKGGVSHERIVNAAIDAKADIICLGSHGRTGLERLLMGSVTEKVIGHAPCPVLVVKS